MAGRAPRFSLSRLETVSVENYVERAPGNAENLSGASAVPIGSVERPPNEFLLHRLQCRADANDKLIFAVLDLVNFLRKIAEAYPAMLSRDHGALDRIPKLPHIARPPVH